MSPSPENRFVFVAPMYNASASVGQMLASVVAQSYKNWRVILIDDVSDHHEVLKEQTIVESWRQMVDPGNTSDKISVIWNDEKKWEVANVLHGITMCDDNDIIARIDADDWLTEVDALMILNSMYNVTGADALWTAHRWGYTDKNISGPMPPDADPYKHPWVSSHLKTFRKRLINEVIDDNFRGDDGEYIRRAGDQAIFLPVLHQARRRGFVPRVMYHYSIKDVPETYQTPDARFQRDEAMFLRERGYIS
jgi:glycosyltransferase involved in cell wall biosynthesis